MSTQRGPKSLLTALKAAPTVSYSSAQRPHPLSVQHERQCGWEEKPVSEHMTKELVKGEEVFSTATEVAVLISQRQLGNLNRQPRGWGLHCVPGTVLGANCVHLDPWGVE